MESGGTETHVSCKPGKCLNHLDHQVYSFALLFTHKGYLANQPQPHTVAMLVVISQVSDVKRKFISYKDETPKSSIASHGGVSSKNVYLI